MAARLVSAGGYTQLGDASIYDIWRHFTTRGHAGRALCVDATEGLDYIVTGGVDYTVRIWRFDKQRRSHVLAGIVRHPVPETQQEVPSNSLKSFVFKKKKVDWDADGVARQGITAVHCVGSRHTGPFEDDEPERIGPFLGGSVGGDLNVACFFGRSDGARDTHTFGMFGLHKDAINDICVLPLYGNGEDGKSFLVVTASADGEAAMSRLDCDQGSCEQYELESVLLFRKLSEIEGRRLKHDSPVLKVKHVGENSKEVCFVTCTAVGVHLWTMEGINVALLSLEGQASMYSRMDRMHSLSVSVTSHKGIAVANRPRGSLLFVEGGKYVGVWAINRGRVAAASKGDLDYDAKWEEAKRNFATEGVCSIPPLGVYKKGEPDMAGMDVDQSEATSFALQVTSPFCCTMWNLEGVASGHLMLEPPEPANLLVMPGRENILLELQHTSKVCQLVVKHDPDDDEGGACGAALLTATDSGTVYCWDLEGADKGQVMSELRSLTAFEILFPPFMMIVGALQVLSFAFGPSVKWKKDVHRPAMVIHRIMLFDIKYQFVVDEEEVFWYKTYAIMGVICIFMFWAMTGAPQVLDELMRMVQDTERFEEESAHGMCHIVLIVLKAAKKLVSIFMTLCASVLVAPTMLSLAQAVDCVSTDGHGDNVLERKADTKMVLEVATDVECYAGAHLQLTIAVFVILVPYVTMLIPFASVSGDCNYMPRSTLYDRTRWMSAANRKATNKNLGFLHQVPGRSFQNQMLELSQKILFPVITCWMTAKPRTQMALVSLVSIVVYAVMLAFPPFIEEKYCALVQNIKLLTVLTSLSGFVTACINNTDSWIPVVLLVASLAIVLGNLIYQLAVVPARRPAVRIFDVDGRPIDASELT